MGNNPEVAGGLLNQAAHTILKDRPDVHGDAENSFGMIADLWSVYLGHVFAVRASNKIQPEDVAEMMSLLKKARKVYGDPTNEDNDIDDLGYTALGGMLRAPDPEPDTDDEALDKLEVELLKADRGSANIKTKHLNINLTNAAGVPGNVSVRAQLDAARDERKS